MTTSTQITGSLFFAFGSILAAHSAAAASFPCNNASTSVERLICSDDALSASDDNLAVAYRNAMDAVRETPDQRRELLASQKAWLIERNKCNDSSCIGGKIAEQTAVLKNWQVKISPTNAPEGEAYESKPAKPVARRQPTNAMPPKAVASSSSDASGITTADFARRMKLYHDYLVKKKVPECTAARPSGGNEALAERTLKECQELAETAYRNDPLSLDLFSAEQKQRIKKRADKCILGGGEVDICQENASSEVRFYDLDSPRGRWFSRLMDATPDWVYALILFAGILCASWIKSVVAVYTLNTSLQAAGLNKLPYNLRTFFSLGQIKRTLERA